MLVLPDRCTLQYPVVFGSLGMMAGCGLLSFQRSPVFATIIVVFIGFSAGPVWPVIISTCRHLNRSSRFTAGVIGIGALGAAVGPVLSSNIIRYMGLNRFFPALAVFSALMFAAAMLLYVRTRKTLMPTRKTHEL